MPRISHALPLHLCALTITLLPMGCSSEKKEADIDKVEKQESVTSGTKVTEVAPSAPVEIAELPAEKSDVQHLGTLQFGINHGSPMTDAARSLAIDSAGDYIVAGYFQGGGIFGSDFKMEDLQPDAFLAKLSKKDGTPIWSVALGGKNADIAEAVAVGSDGSSVVVGAMSEDLNVGDGVLTSSGADDIFIAKFDANGRRLWVKQIGGPDVDAAHSVVIDSAGNSYITGVFRYRVVFGVDIESRAKGNGDIFLSKVSPGGEFLWTKTFGAIDDDIGISLTIDPADNIIFTGSFEGNINLGGADLTSAGKADIFVAKYNANGVHIWSRGFGGKDADWGNSIASDSLGNSFIAGWFRYDVDFDSTKLTSKGEQDALLVKLDPKGKVLWAKSFGDKSLDMGKAVEVNTDDSIVAVGVFNVSIDLGAGPITPATKDDKPPRAGDFWLATFTR